MTTKLKYHWFFNQTSLYASIVLWLALLAAVRYYSSANNIQSFKNILKTKEPSNSNNDTLVDLANFKFLMNNASLCEESSKEGHASIVVMIHSARCHFNGRYAIRNTWGSVKVYKRWHFHLIFLLGIGDGKDSEIEHKLLNESKQHGDMVMGNFLDTYQNLTYKHLMGYKWVSKFCPTAKFILKTDDDVYADLFQVVEVILAELNHSKYSFACLNMYGNNPHRDVNSKWYISKEIYSDDKYPEFCSGVAYLMKVDDAAKIYFASTKTSFVWIDDAFVTGILREKYDHLVNNSTTSSLNILSLQTQYNFKLDLRSPDMILWCNTGLESNQLNYTYIILEDRVDFIRNMFCIWNKIRLQRFAVNMAPQSLMLEEAINSLKSTY